MLPSRNRGPRSKAARRAAGLDVIVDSDREERAAKVPRRSPAHCNFVRDHGCIVPDCGRRPIEVMHVRRGTGGGMGMKPSDRWTVSGCQYHHSEQHRIGEESFEQKYGVDLKALAEEFARKSPKWAILKDMP